MKSPSRVVDWPFRVSWSGVLAAAMAAVGLGVGAPAEHGTRGAAVAWAAPASTDGPDTLGAAFGPLRPGAAVYPRQSIPLRFDHRRHLAEGLDCETCHDRVRTSTRASESNFPRGAACDGCHGDAHVLPATDRPEDLIPCSTCHVGAEGERITQTRHTPTPRLIFNHALHLDRGATCESCHGDMSRVRLATELQLPREATCLECHDGTDAPGKATDRCAACHPTGPSGRLLTRRFDEPADPPLLPRGASHWGASHDVAFVRDHAAIAKANGDLCDSCHDDSDCQDCHSGVLRPMRLHSPDYVTLHAADARAMRTDCASCHRLQTDCAGCHERTGVMAGSGEGVFGVGSPLRFHPAGWASGVSGPQGHAFAAQRNMSACVSCHEEDTCLSCHATTDASTTPGLGFSPHGPGFSGSLRCRSLVNANRRVCLRCHAPGDPDLACG